MAFSAVRAACWSAQARPAPSAPRQTHRRQAVLPPPRVRPLQGRLISVCQRAHSLHPCFSFRGPIFCRRSTHGRDLPLMSRSGTPAYMAPEVIHSLPLLPCPFLLKFVQSATRSTDVDLGGELHEVVHSAAQSDDVLAHFVQAHKEAGSHKTRTKRLSEVMQTNLITVKPDDSVSHAERLMRGIEGMPVVDDAGHLVGVISKKDLVKGGSVVGDVMSSSPVALGPQDKVTEAAHTMIDHKFHRVPVVDDAGVCVGIVTRTDIFWALASDNDRATFFHDHGIDV